MVLWVFFAVSSFARAEKVDISESRRGAFLANGVSARAVAMGEAFTAVADDASASYWNPGGLGRISGINALAMYDMMGEGIGLGYLAGAMPAGPGVAGASVSLLNFGTYDVRNDYGEKTGTAGASDLAVSVSYGLSNPDWMRFAGWSGVSVECVKEAVGAALFGLGAGTTIPLGPSLTGGASLQHFGPGNGGFSLPSVARAGVAWAAMEWLTASTDLAYAVTDREPVVALGAEAVPHPMLAVRLGYRWRPQNAALGGMTGLSAGIGVKWEDFGLDYAFQPFGDLVTAHRVALVYGLGAAGGGKAGAVVDASDTVPSGRPVP